MHAIERSVSIALSENSSQCLISVVCDCTKLYPNRAHSVPQYVKVMNPEVRDGFGTVPRLLGLRDNLLLGFSGGSSHLEINETIVTSL